jgi:uncharacterized protein YecT (DUF1311 family)
MFAAVVESPRLDCRDPKTQMEITVCSSEEFERVDADLNRVWRRASSKLHAFDQSAERKRDKLTALYPILLASQRAWLRYREEQCTFESKYSAEGGSAEQSFGSRCRTRLTKQRIEELQRSGQDQ